jgi:hypothetical protein
MLSMTSTSILSIRPAEPTEDAVLRDLSELDATPALRRPALLAIVDDQPVAALSLADGRVAADPFTRTEDVVTILRAHVEQLTKAA